MFFIWAFGLHLRQIGIELYILYPFLTNKIAVAMTFDFYDLNIPLLSHIISFYYLNWQKLPYFVLNNFSIWLEGDFTC